MEAFFDESGRFGAPNPGDDGLAVVVGLIVPQNHTEALRDRSSRVRMEGWRQWLARQRKIS
jgi:hypothetical protein